MGHGAGGLKHHRPRQDAATILATVGGLGYLPWAPGTWGSVVGLFLGWAAVRSVDPVRLGAVLVASFVLGALVCTRAERRLGHHDPPAVILDEVWGMAAIVILLPWLASSRSLLLVAFLLFRTFDIGKPPPLPWLARWPSGWGIMADDLGAAGYTTGILWLAARLANFS